MKVLQTIENNGNEIKVDQDFKIKEQGKRIYYDVVINTPAASSGGLSINDVIKNFFSQVLISLDYRDINKGAVVICQEMSIGRLAEFASLQEGAINVKITNEENTNSTRIQFAVDLSPNGNVDINGEQYLRCKLRNLEGLGITSIDVRIEKTNEESRTIICYERHNMAENDTIERISGKDGAYIITPIQPYDHIDITFPSGINDEIDKAQAEHMMYDTNDVVMYISTIVESGLLGRATSTINGFLDYYILPIFSASEISLQTNGMPNEYTIVKHKTLNL